MGAALGGTGERAAPMAWCRETLIHTMPLFVSFVKKKFTIRTKKIRLLGRTGVSRWQELWKSAAVREQWSTPDRAVIALAARLQHEQKRRVYDLGCGPGRHTLYLARQGFEVYASDHAPVALTYCRQRLAQEGLVATLTEHDMGVIPYPDRFFHAVIAFNVIYHGLYARMQQVVATVQKKLTAGGYFLFTLLSTRHSHFGQGIPVEPHTFIDPEAEEKSTPHHYSDQEEVLLLTRGMRLLSVEEVDQRAWGGKGTGGWHWVVLAQVPDAGQPQEADPSRV
ncbi:MAG: class I SAM-dependent methyltransferase [Nitrospinota bacterium]|nr:MAG: class I SAM-dependent methyltransferase [Nitrospinota bacterium]